MLGIEDIEAGLVAYIKGLIRVKDSDGQPQSILVLAEKPEEEFKEEEYPCVTLSNVNSGHSNYSRYADGGNGEYRVLSRNDASHTMRVKNQDLQFTFPYQIDFWAKYKEHMNSMIEQWTTVNYRDFSFTATDLETNIEYQCFAVRLEENIQKLDTLKGLDRTYHSAVTYRVEVEFDSGVEVTLPMVSEVAINPAANP